MGKSFHSGSRHGIFSVDVKRVPVFPPSPVAFHVGPSCGFKGSGGLVDCASRVDAIDWLVLSTDGNRCYKWRGTFSKCLCIFSEVSLCHDGR